MMKQIFFAVLFLVWTSMAQAQPVIAVDIDKGKLQFSWTQGSGGMPTFFKSKCGTSSGTHGTLFSQSFVQSSDNLYTIPVSAATANSPGTYFCVVVAGNPVGESAPTNEISFFAGTVPAAPIGLGVLAQ